MKKLSDHIPLGNTVTDEGTFFRFFSPKAKLVQLEVSKSYTSKHVSIHEMHQDDQGIWYFHHPDNLTGYFYGYRITAPDTKSGFFMETDHLIADPYSQHVTTKNHYLQYAKTKIVDNGFDWEGDRFNTPTDYRDLIIYEAHLKDMSAHPSAKASGKSAYLDFIDSEVGGINHLKKLGVNAIEFLPLQKFAYFEPPFNNRIKSGIENTWNPHSINHWGYMTSYYFAPETLYASEAKTDQGKVIGQKEHAIYELKTLVKQLHKEGFTVIMDVVYNHASHYDLNPLKYAAKEHYFRLDQLGGFQNDSWTGNDIATESQFGRRLIVESIKYWMQEFHIDGFRFDLAGLIDWKTVDIIRLEAQEINPDVILIAEPWGGEYKPEGFSNHGWASWNDRLRNGVKGLDPDNGRGFIFGEWIHGFNRFTLENFIRGTLSNNDHGLFKTSEHTVNYIEAHDGYTIGDFIRIALNNLNRQKVFKSTSEATKMNEKELKLAKLAASFLFVSQGITMIHSGQEWGRAKVIHDDQALDENVGLLDHDSYNKDNLTNYLNFDDLKLNQDLFDYYKGLILMRKSSPALRKARPDQINFKVYNDPLHITFEVYAPETGDPYSYFISINGSPNKNHNIILPEGDWEIIADGARAGNHPFEYVKYSYFVEASSTVILRRLRNIKA